MAHKKAGGSSRNGRDQQVVDSEFMALPLLRETLGVTR